jgi:hypothetical protein
MQMQLERIGPGRRNCRPLPVVCIWLKSLLRRGEAAGANGTLASRQPQPNRRWSSVDARSYPERIPGTKAAGRMACAQHNPVVRECVGDTLGERTVQSYRATTPCERKIFPGYRNAVWISRTNWLMISLHSARLASPMKPGIFAALPSAASDDLL